MSAPIFCYVTDRASLRSPEPREALAALLDCIASAAAAGVPWIQLREKDLAARYLARLTSAAMDRCALAHSGVGNLLSSRTRIFVNDRLDVAIAERAAGVRLGENSLPVNEAKRLLQNLSSENRPAEFLAGVSCHSLASAQAAAAAGADYIFFGPIFPTPSKH